MFCYCKAFLSLKLGIEKVKPLRSENTVGDVFSKVFC